MFLLRSIFSTTFVILQCCKKLSIFSAIQYNIPQEYIPDSQYRCTHHECPWSQYEEDIDFGFWKDGEERITSCQTCMERCNNDPSCGSVECGPDHNLPDGTVLYGYCSWWAVGKCEKAAEFSTNPANYIWTCKKERKFKSYKKSSN